MPVMSNANYPAVSVSYNYIVNVPPVYESNSGLAFENLTLKIRNYTRELSVEVSSLSVT